MSNDEVILHNINGGPGILYPEEVASKTRHSKVELAHLAKLGILRPLAWPLPSNARRLYSKLAVDAYLSSPDAMEKGRRALLKLWRFRNSNRGDTTEGS